ncbi:ornithine cyclodeaminase [Neorhizobium galegae]|uniref:ornithine cyclodeaminase family protein n=1 Tax=Neorhizobium galegae TaxID=399 RepID=UPI001AEA53FA|nr:ornithine cyclodeaminase family protein [Neorhizobium galegae]MBP2547874.1 ornithine cyclodeaminase [Neorhizobium galegae]
MTRILTDHDLQMPALMPLAIEAVEDVLRQRARGAFVSPPRHAVSIDGAGDLVFTIGGGAGGQSPVAGFRAYTTFSVQQDDQLVAVWNVETGTLKAVVIGSLLGAIRTGAIGGAAIRYLSREDAQVVAVIGSGLQARTQLEAAVAVRPVREVRVFSRSAENRDRFAMEMQQRLGRPVQAVETARAAVEGADIVLCATVSPEPVIRAEWLKPGAHINTVGPKTAEAHELPVEVAAMARRIATDSPAQLQAYGRPFFLAGTPQLSRMEDLADIVAGALPAGATGQGRGLDDVTLFCSTGLAGTEVVVASALSDHLDQSR